MMTRLLLLAVGMAYVAAEDCWKIPAKEDTTLKCDDASQKKTGDLETMQAECEKNKDACKAVVCANGKNECSIRLWEQCKTTLPTESKGAVVHLKACKNALTKWTEWKDTYLKCENPDKPKIDYVDSLLDRQIRCAEMIECVGVTCKKKKDGGYEKCSLRLDANGCSGERTSSTTTNEDSWTKKSETSSGAVKPPPPAGSTECEWKTHVDQRFRSCSIDKTKMTARTLDDAKKACLKEEIRCNGIECHGDGASCYIHEHCVDENAKMMTSENAKGITTYGRLCEIVDKDHACNSPCWPHKEHGGHECFTSCDCAGARYCSGGICQGDESPEPCRDELDCVYDTFESRYMPCYAKGDAKQMTLDEAKQHCIEARDDCAGVTCDKDGCTLRNHYIEGNLDCKKDHKDGQLGKKFGETTHVKCCGSDKLKRLTCPGHYASPPSSSGHTGFFVFLIILLLAIIGGMAYRNRAMAHNYHVPANFSPAAEDEDDEENNWIVDDDKDEA